MSFFPVSNHPSNPPSDPDGVAWPPASMPAPIASARVASCFDFPAGEPSTPGESFRVHIPIRTAMAEARRIADVCKRPGDPIATAQLAFWCQVISDLERMAVGDVRSLGGEYAEDLCWRHLQFDRRHAPGCGGLCHAIDRYFDLRHRATELLCRFRSTGSREDVFWKKYVEAGQFAERFKERLHVDRLRLSADPTLEGGAAPQAMSLPSRPVSSVPPPCRPWMDGMRIAWPPSDLSDRQVPSPDRGASRP